MCQRITFNAFINNRWRIIFIDNKSLSIETIGADSSFTITLAYRVIGIALGKDKFFLAFKNDSPTNLLKNNVSAYDYNGKFLYNIGDLVPQNDVYVGIHINANIENTICPYSEVPLGHEYLTCIGWDRNYIIDITVDKFIKQEETR